MKPDLPIILVRFLGARNSKPYAYFVPPWITVEKLDIVVVEVRDSVGLAKVVSTSPTPTAASYASAYVVEVIDLQSHRSKVAELLSSFPEEPTDAN